MISFNFKPLTLMSNFEIFVPDFVQVGFVVVAIFMCVVSMIVFVVMMIRHYETPEYDERTHGDYGQNEDFNNLNE